VGHGYSLFVCSIPLLLLLLLLLLLNNGFPTRFFVFIDCLTLQPSSPTPLTPFFNQSVPFFLFLLLTISFLLFGRVSLTLTIAIAVAVVFTFTYLAITAGLIHVLLFMDTSLCLDMRLKLLLR
jgi:hypothetical protein